MPSPTPPRIFTRRQTKGTSEVSPGKYPILGSEEVESLKKRPLRATQKYALIASHEALRSAVVELSIELYDAKRKERQK
jgi:hypothetical protein